ncbi:uncharacterized protein I206_100615 [Kwoniella pini CBS 10737]|uniref:Uncharacterized protein n=1 Tax=Kwoniella pini CBS 10737 TaxID=1296096 RepID=A0A1B9ID62_9TREE|nr:uncharacterized protein I206_00710 [Kwoniella pini CBS 10737]OCF53407.1 hypothetical protein I206_00710 [Kwoniella pini CBS 10737]
MVSPNKPSTPSTSTSKNYHPYLIHSSASSLLTRTNSSPVQPVSPNYHRSSRSMSSLNQILENKDNKTENCTEENRRKSMEIPQERKIGINRRPGVKRSGTLPEFLNNCGKLNTKESKEIDLPLNPKSWTPSELAQYLGYTLRTGGPEGTGHILPAPLVEDIKSWVLRQRVSGKDFLKGSSDGWGNTTRPPPFLPLLQTIARRLRRHSLSGRIESVPANPDDSFGKGSILMEENEDEEEDVGSDELTGVRRMVNAFDAKSSSSVSESSASGDDEEAGKLKPQLTGESVGERWKAWEERLGDTRRRNRRVSDVSSVDSMSDRYIYRNEVKMEDEHEVEEANAGGTIKAPLSVPSLATSGSHDQVTLPQGMTPPPPYTSPFFDSTDRLPIQHLPTLTECLTPERPNDGRYSVTPTPERTSNAGLGISTPLLPTSSPDNTPSKVNTSSYNQSEGCSPHMKNMSNHSVKGSNPYAALRRTSSSGSNVKHPSVKQLNLVNHNCLDEEEEEEGYLSGAQLSPANAQFAGEELEGSRWTTARRVTLKPSKVQNIFEGESISHASSIVDIENDKSIQLKDDLSKQKEMVENQMNILLNRIKELENKLDNVKNVNTNDIDFEDKSKKQNEIKKLDKGIFDILGFSRKNSNENDGLPKTVRELPVYLFLVGFGVGAVFVRVLFGRSR